MFPTEALNLWLAVVTVALQGATVGLFVLYFLRTRPVLSGIVGILRTWGFRVALTVSIAASALTLFYSEVIGFPPCPLCWWQRVFLYPQVVSFAQRFVFEFGYITLPLMAATVFAFLIALMLFVREQDR